MDITTVTSKHVKKPVEAIQCANTFSLVQRKMYNVLLANAAGNLHSGFIHRISMSVLCELMGYHSNDYKKIKNQFRELRRMDIEWDIINDEGYKVWTNTSPLSLARIIEGKGICEYEFTPSLIPYLDRPAQYAKFSLSTQSKFKSSYGLALYENCERYRNLGKTKLFDISIFRKLMGVKDNEYLEFFALKRRVILIAINEVNKHADFEITPEYIKSGRQVIKIGFLISHKKMLLPEKLTNLQSEDELVNSLTGCFKLGKKDVNLIIQQYERGYIQEKINETLNSNCFRLGKIRNLAGYLKESLKNDYKPAVSSKQAIDKVVRDKELQEAQLKIIENNISEAKRNYRLYISDEINNIINTFGNDEAYEIEKNFLEYLKVNDSNMYLQFTKKGIKTGAVTVAFKKFIKEFYCHIYSKVISPLDYVTRFYPNLLQHIEDEYNEWG